MIENTRKKELLRLVTAGISIGAASDRVGVSRSTGTRWVQRLKTGQDSQQAYTERQKDRALNAGGERVDEETKRWAENLFRPRLQALVAEGLGVEAACERLEIGNVAWARELLGE